MQSSTAIAIRALVMLIVLISVPLFAIFGKNLPDVLKGWLEGRSLVLSPAPGAPQNQQVAGPLPASSNPFGQGSPYRAGSDPNIPGVATATSGAPGSVNPNSMNGTSTGTPNAGMGVASSSPP